MWVIILTYFDYCAEHVARTAPAPKEEALLDDLVDKITMWQAGQNAGPMGNIPFPTSLVYKYPLEDEFHGVAFGESGCMYYDHFYKEELWNYTVSSWSILI